MIIASKCLQLESGAIGKVLPLLLWVWDGYTAARQSVATSTEGFKALIVLQGKVLPLLLWVLDGNTAARLPLISPPKQLWTRHGNFIQITSTVLYTIRYQTQSSNKIWRFH